MKKIILFSLLLSLGFMSCDSKYQYGVWAKNSTNEDLILAYKTTTDERGTVEEEITLKAGENKRIIWTTNLDFGEGWTGTLAEHCGSVAEYVRAKKSDGTPSNIEWCTNDVRFEKTDIGQAEFMIEYKPENF